MTIPVKLALDPRIAYVHDERWSGNGLIIELKRGWSFDALCDNRVIGADGLHEGLRLLARARPFAGPYED